MSKIHEKIMKVQFAKSLKKLIILAVCVMLLGGGISAVMLRQQIGEVVSNAKQWEQKKENDGENYEGDRRQEGEGRHRGEDDFFENMVVTKPTTAAVITVGLTAFCGFLFLALFWLLIAAWLYQAAVRSGMNGLLWLAAGMIGNIYAAAMFLLIRSFIRIKCPACGVFLSAKVQHCPKCGAVIHETCADCGENCAPGDQFCHTCGKRLHEDNE